MTVDIYIGGTKAHLVWQLEAVLDELRAQPEGHAHATIHGVSNDAERSDINVTFSNEDMEGRPEVAELVFVEVQS